METLARHAMALHQLGGFAVPTQVEVVEVNDMPLHIVPQLYLVPQDVPQMMTAPPLIPQLDLRLKAPKEAPTPPMSPQGQQGGVHETMRPWSANEDYNLLEWHDEFTDVGKKPSWTLIAERFGTTNPRTISMVRNRYMRIVKGRRIVANALANGKRVNKCGKCGHPKRGHVCALA